MTDTLWGKVLSVETQNLGEPTTGGAIGVTELPVDDASTFDEHGGEVTINGDVLPYTAIDADTDTLTMAAALVTAVSDGDYVEVYPPSPIKTALVDLGDNSDPLPATIPLNLLDRLPDGTRDPGRQETVALERRGIYEYVVADVTAEPVISQTLDFTDAESGIELSESLAQFQDANVRGVLAVTDLSAESLTLGGTDLVDRLGALPVGKLLSARLGLQGSNIAMSGTLSKILELNCGTVQGGRTYRVKTSFVALATGTLALSDRFRVICTYTTDGTTPTTASAIMDGAISEFNYLSGSASLTRSAEVEVDIASTCLLRVAVLVQVLSGAGTYSIYAGASATARPIMSLSDDGPSGSRQDSAISLTGGGIARFVKTFNALWAWGSLENGALINDSYFYIGNCTDGTVGRYGLVGFDSTAIVAALANSVTPISCTLRWIPRTRKTAAGLDVRIMTHAYASRVAAQTGESWPETWDRTGALTSRGIASNAAPGTPYSFNMNTLFASFKAGTIKGVAFANSAADVYANQPDGSGSIYGNGTSECQLICVYDGTT